MNFLANENFPYPSIKILREKGFYVKSIGEDLGGISDESVMEIVVKENLIILTFDRDYGELIFKFQNEKPPAVVYFRLKGDTPEMAATLLLRIMAEGITIENHFTVVESNGIRQRKLKQWLPKNTTPLRALFCGRGCPDSHNLLNGLKSEFRAIKDRLSRHATRFLSNTDKPKQYHLILR